MTSLVGASGAGEGFLRNGLVRRPNNLVQARSSQMRGTAQARVRAMLIRQAVRALAGWPKVGRVLLKTAAPAESIMGPCSR